MNQSVFHGSCRKGFVHVAQVSFLSSGHGLKFSGLVTGVLTFSAQ